MTTTAPARERLLDAAVESFAEQGFTATTTRDIASRAGLSPAAVYVHYASKEELLFHVSLEGHRQALEVLRSAADPRLAPLERLRAMIRTFSHWHALNGRIARVVQHELRALAPEHREQVASLRRDIEATVRETLIDGVADGSAAVDDVRGTALAILSLSIDLVRWYSPDHAGRPDAVSSNVGRPDEVAALHGDLAVRMVRA